MRPLQLAEVYKAVKGAVVDLEAAEGLVVRVVRVVETETVAVAMGTVALAAAATVAAAADPSLERTGVVMAAEGMAVDRAEAMVAVAATVMEEVGARAEVAMVMVGQSVQPRAQPGCRESMGVVTGTEGPWSGHRHSSCLQE